MPNRLMSSLVAGAAALVFLPSIFALPANQSPTAQSTTENNPRDLTGVWKVEKFHPNLVPMVGAPLTPAGQARLKKANPDVNDPNLACLPPGMPRIMFVPLPFEIFQVPGRVLIFQEAANQFLQIYLNRPHLKDPDPTYNGDSIGKWEGDTLVVDTIGLNDITWIDHVGLPHTDALHVTQRIHRVDHDTLQNDVTIEDPGTFTKPWSVTQIYKLRPGWEIQEYVCDNNKYVYHDK